MQFNWIFVLIAGIFILSFFAFFSFKYIELKEHEKNVLSAYAFSQNMDILSTSSSSFYCVPGKHPDCSFLGDVRLSYFCSEKSASVRVNHDTSISLGNALVFMDADLSGKLLGFFVEPLSLPYYVANLIFIVSMDTEYIFVYDDHSYDRLVSLSLPSDLPFTFVSLSQYVPHSGDVVLYVGESRPGDLFVLGDMLTFPSGKSYVLFDDILLVAALVSGDEETFACVYSRLRLHYEQVTQSYVAKTRLLQFYHTSCPYVSFKELLQQPLTQTHVQQLLTSHELLTSEGCTEVF